MAIIQKSFSDLVDFTRGSTATYTDATGIIRTAAIDEPRFVYGPATGKPEGLLVEGQATNLLLWSEDFSKPEWNDSHIGVTSSQSSQPSPIAGVNYGEVIEDAGDSLKLFRSPWYDYATDDRFSWSFIIKPVETPFFCVQVDSTSNRLGFRFGLDLDAVEAVSVPSGTVCDIEPLVGGAFLVSIVTPPASESGSGRVGIGPRLTRGNAFETRPAISGVAFRITRLQLERAATPSSYIPTEGSQVTRATDDAVIPVGDWFNPDEGTFVVEGEAQQIGTSDDQNTATLLKVGDSLTSSDALVIDRVGGTNDYFARTRTLDGGLTSLGLGNSSGIVKIAASYTDGGDIRGVLNGGDVVTGTNRWGGTGDFLYIGAGGLQGAGRALRRANGPISRITYYPRALTDEQLQELTK